PTTLLWATDSHLAQLHKWRRQLETIPTHCGGRVPGRAPARRRKPFRTACLLQQFARFHASDRSGSGGVQDRLGGSGRAVWLHERWVWKAEKPVAYLRLADRGYPVGWRRPWFIDADGRQPRYPVACTIRNVRCSLRGSRN